MPEPKSEPLLTISDVYFDYDNGSQLLRGVDLVVYPGQVVAIMGQSGSGKTTLLRLITGQHRPKSGTIHFAGHAVHSAKGQEIYEIRKEQGMLFQFGALFTDLSVYDNVAFPLRERTGLSEELIHDLVLMKLQAVGLRGTQNLMPAELSGGMARRVALARTIALDPKLIIYDEPFTGLDPITLATISQLTRKFNDALYAASLVVTHDIEATFKVVDYVYFLYKGKVAARGTPEEIRRTDDPYVQQFISGKLEGPVSFQYPAPDYGQALGL